MSELRTHFCRTVDAPRTTCGRPAKNEGMALIFWDLRLWNSPYASAPIRCINCVRVVTSEVEAGRVYGPDDRFEVQS